ncbi:MAG: class GN sortase [Sedimenticola sp.]|nr:class GN sortase [Sedimenticola sp.]
MNASRRYRYYRPAAFLLAIVGVWQIGAGGYIQAKALLAQWLLQSAWTQTLKEDERVRPWPWADTWPVARLQVDRLGVDQIVLSGDSGRTLAFGPGHRVASDHFSFSGNSVLSGHRDTHFRFLRLLDIDDRIRITLPDGQRRIYAVISRDVVQEDAVWVLDPSQPMLTLITCYPFDALVSGGTGRFVVRAAPLYSGQEMLAPAAPPFSDFLFQGDLGRVL